MMDAKTARMQAEWEAAHADPTPEDEAMLEAEYSADRLYEDEIARAYDETIVRYASPVEVR